MYEIIAGRPPLHGREREGVLASLRRGEIPPLLPLQPEAPRELLAIVEQALAVEPERRYPDARALAADVSRFLDGRRVNAHRYSLWQELLRRARAWRAPLTVAAVAGMLLLLLALWAFHRTRHERDAAIAAEERTRRALAAADHSLSRVLIEQALAAAASAAQPEAEVLAARALVLSESPEARGVLADFARVVRPVLRERTELPACPVARPQPDGRVLCVEDGTVVVWGGRPLRRLWQEPLRARDAAWLDGGRRVVVTTDGNQAHLFDADGAPLGRAAGQLTAPYGLSTASASGFAVLGNFDGVSIFDPRTREISTVAPCGARGQQLAATLGPRGEHIAAACKDGSVVILSAAGALVQRAATPFTDPRAGASALALGPDGQTLLIGTLEGDLAVLDLKAGALRSLHRLDSGIVRSLHVAPEGARVLILGERGGATLWQLDPGVVLRRLPALGDHAAVWSADGAELITAGSELRRWSIPAVLPPLRLVPQRLPGLAGAALSPTSEQLAVARGDGHLEVIETHSGRLVFRDRFQLGVLKGVSYLRGSEGPEGSQGSQEERGELVAWAAGTPSVRRYDVAGRVLGTYDLTRLRRAALLPSGWLAAIGYAHGAALHDLSRPGAPPHRIGEHEFIDAAQSGDGRTIAAINLEGEVWLISDTDLARGTGGGEPPRGRLLLQQRGVTAVALSADGALLALADERSVRLIDVATRTERARCTSPGRRILDLALSPDGRWLAAGDLDQIARIWSARDGRLVAVLRGHTGRVAGVSFSRDGGTLVTASWDGSARLWGLDVLDRPAADLLHETESAWGLSETEPALGTRP